MRNFYYITSNGKEYAYQDEEVKRDEAQKLAYETKVATKAVPTKQELVAEVSAHKLEYVKEVTDSKTQLTAEVKEEVLASEADVILQWDGTSPYYEVVSGVAPAAVPFLGWPQVSKEDYVEPVAEPVREVIEEIVESLPVETPEDIK